MTSVPAAMGPAGRPLAAMAGRTFSDRLKLPIYAGVGLALLSVLGIGAFSSLDSGSLFDDLPAAFDGLIGGSAGGNYVVSEVFGLIAPIVVLTIAISGGVNAVAGEERDRTAGLLLTQPVARRDLVIAKAAVVTLHVLVCVGLFIAGFVIGSALFDSGVATADALATAAHLLALGLAFAMLALALSASTGSASLSLAAAGGLAVVADLMAAMLPLVNGLEDVAKASPWFYYNGSQPLVNGPDPVHLAVLLAIAGTGLVLALIGIERRDIESGNHRAALVIPGLDHFTRARVDSVFAKSLSERVTLAALAGGSLASMAIAVALMFGGLQDTLQDLSESVPAGVAGLYGSGDLGTPVGWINAEMVSIVLPAVMIAVAVMLGVGAVAGEQKHHTLDLLLSAPVTRGRVVIEKAAALAVVVVGIGVLGGLGMAAGSALGGLGIGAADIAAAVSHATLLALFFGALALAVGAVTSAQTATRVAAIAALLSYMMQAFLPSSAALKDVAVVSPWHYFSSSTPLANGVDVAHLLVLALLAALALAAALVLVNRREVSA